MQQIARSVALAFNNLPRPHRVMLGSLTVAHISGRRLAALCYHPSSAPIIKTIELEKARSALCCPRPASLSNQAAQEDEAIRQDELDDKIQNEAGIHEYVVSTGDTLSSVLNQYGIDMGNISQLAASDKELRNLKIGQQLPGPNARRRSATFDLGDVPSRNPHLQSHCKRFQNDQ